MNLSFQPASIYVSKEPVSKLIEGSYASPSLVAGILYDKCALDIPFYRQEKDLCKTEATFPDRLCVAESWQWKNNILSH